MPVCSFASASVSMLIVLICNSAIGTQTLLESVLNYDKLKQSNH